MSQTTFVLGSAVFCVTCSAILCWHKLYYGTTIVSVGSGAHSCSSELVSVSLEMRAEEKELCMKKIFRRKKSANSKEKVQWCPD